MLGKGDEGKWVLGEGEKYERKSRSQTESERGYKLFCLSDFTLWIEFNGLKSSFF